MGWYLPKVPSTAPGTGQTLPKQLAFSLSASLLSRPKGKEKLFISFSFNAHLCLLCRISQDVQPRKQTTTSFFVLISLPVIFRSFLQHHPPPHPLPLLKLPRSLTLGRGQQRILSMSLTWVLKSKTKILAVTLSVEQSKLLHLSEPISSSLRWD